jgi:hypothetical protein
MKIEAARRPKPAFVRVGSAIIHLMDDWKAFYDEPRVVTDQDSIWYGAAFDETLNILHVKYLELQQEWQAARKQQQREARKARRSGCATP